MHSVHKENPTSSLNLRGIHDQYKHGVDPLHAFLVSQQGKRKASEKEGKMREKGKLCQATTIIPNIPRL